MTIFFNAASLQSFCPQFKEFLQDRQVGFIGFELDQIGADAMHELFVGVQTLLLEGPQFFLHRGVGDADDSFPACFQVCDRCKRHERQFFFSRIADGDADEVVFACDERGLFGEVRAEKVRNEKTDARFYLNLSQEGQGCGGIRSFACRGMQEHFADDAQDVAGVLARGKILFDSVGIENQADFIIVAQGCEGQDGPDFGHELTLQLLACAKALRSGDVQDEHDVQFALFAKCFHVEMVAAGRLIPVDVTLFVSWLILAGFLKLETLAAKGGAIGARKESASQMGCLNLDAVHKF